MYYCLQLYKYNYVFKSVLNFNTYKNNKGIKKKGRSYGNLLFRYYVLLINVIINIIVRRTILHFINTYIC